MISTPFSQRDDRLFTPKPSSTAHPNNDRDTPIVTIAASVRVTLRRMLMEVSRTT